MILELTVFDPDVHLKQGEVWTMHVHVDSAAIMLDAVLKKRDAPPSEAEGTAYTDEWKEPAEQVVYPMEWARVEVTATNRPVAIEEARKLPQLSKFVIRAGKKAVAYGRCVEILE